jgi:hypothetical protein
MQAVRELLLGETFGCPFEQSYDVVKLVEAGGHTLKMCSDPPLIVKSMHSLLRKLSRALPWALNVILGCLHVHQIHLEKELQLIPTAMGISV